jgi:ABC-type uncharacterized transport system auxiliary subunit
MGATASESCLRQGRKLAAVRFPFVPRWATNPTMKKIFCILASAALLGACEQKTDVVAPASSPAPAEKKTEHNTTVVNPPAVEKKETTNTTVVSTPPTSSSSTTTTTTSSPSP